MLGLRVKKQIKKRNIKYALSLLIFFSTFQSTNAQEFDLIINELSYAMGPARIDVDSSGYFTAIWNDYRHCEGYGNDNEGGAAIYIQKFNMNGVKIGNNIRLDIKKNKDISNTNPDIAINKENGNIAVTWQERSGSSNDENRQSKIVACIYDSNLKKLSFQFYVQPNSNLWQAFPEVKYLSNNNILIIWHINHHGKQFYYAKLYTPLGKIVRDTFLVNKNGVASSTVCFDTISSGGFYFIWDSYIQFYDNFGASVTDIVEGFSKNVIATKSLNEKDILIVTRSDDHRCLYGILYDRMQNLAIKNFRIDDDTTTLNRRGSVDIAVNQFSDFIIVWNDGRNDYNDLYHISDIYAQRFNKNGCPVGNNFKVNHENKEIHQYSPSVSFFLDRFLCIYPQSILERININSSNNLEPVASERNYIVGTRQFFEYPSPGEIYGWEYYLKGNGNFSDFLASPYPNPFVKKKHDFLTIDFNLDRGARVYCAVYNILGQHIKTLYSSNRLSEGDYSVNWYGDTEAGFVPASGLYYFLLKIDSKVYYIKFTFIN